jgi:hypothetical protein
MDSSKISFGLNSLTVSIIFCVSTTITLGSVWYSVDKKTEFNSIKIETTAKDVSDIKAKNEKLTEEIGKVMDTKLDAF